MSMASIRAHYGVPACRGGLVRFQGDEYVITSADGAAMHLWLRSLGSRRRFVVHPTWEMEYILCGNIVIDRDGDEGPCERPAMGYRIDPIFGSRYPVCREHHVPPFKRCEWGQWHDGQLCLTHDGRLTGGDSDWCDKAFEATS